MLWRSNLMKKPQHNTRLTQFRWIIWMSNHMNVESHECWITPIITWSFITTDMKSLIKSCYALISPLNVWNISQMSVNIYLFTFTFALNYLSLFQVIGYIKFGLSSTKCLSLALSNWLYILALYLWLCLCLWLYLWLCPWLSICSPTYTNWCFHSQPEIHRS